MHAVLHRDNITLKEFVFGEHSINIDVLKTLDPEDEKYFLELRHAIHFASILKDKVFQDTIESIKQKLLNPNASIVEIVRDLPENVICELPDKQADMIRQLQYRFADRFTELMSKLLDKRHVENVAIATEEDRQKQLASTPKEMSYWEYGFTFFSTASPVQAQSLPVVKPYQKGGPLHEVIQGISGSSIEKDKEFYEFMELLDPGKGNHKRDFSYLYELRNVSEQRPIGSSSYLNSGGSATRREKTEPAIPGQRRERTISIFTKIAPGDVAQVAVQHTPRRNSVE